MDILVLDKSLNITTLVDDYISFIWSERYNETGDFELCLPMSKGLIDIFPMGYYLSIKESDRLMIIEEHKIESDVEDGDKLFITGRSLEAILDQRVVESQYTFNGRWLGLVLEELVGRNVFAVPQTHLEPDRTIRKINEIQYEITWTPDLIHYYPPWLEKQVSGQFLGESVYSAVQGLCQEHRVGFRIVFRNNTFIFNYYNGTDHSYNQTQNDHVVFSPEFDNFISGNYLESIKDYKTTAVIAGEGDGNDRVVDFYNDSISGLNRREVYVNASNISRKKEDDTEIPLAQYRTMLINAGKKEVEKNYKIKKGFEGEVDAMRTYVYGQDYFLGDIVQVADAYGNYGTSYVSEVVISDDDNGFSIYPTFKTIEEE